jgi:hypothetical protein
MASTYPTSLDNFTNPIAANPLTAPSHAQQHADINDAVEALEAKVAVGNTVLGTWIDYTPTWTGGLTNPVVGNGVILGRYSRVNQLVTAQIWVVPGSTTTFGTGTYQFGLPVTAAATLGSTAALGSGFILDVSLGNATTVTPAVQSSSTSVFSLRYTGASNGAVTHAAPFTFANGDFITATIQYRAA